MRVLYRDTGKSVKDLRGNSTSRSVVEINFDDLEDVLSMKCWKDGTRHGNSYNWYGARSEEVVRLVREGWPEALDSMRGMMDQLQMPDMDISINKRRKRRKKKGDFGNEVDIHAVRQGHSDVAWTRMEHVQIESPQVKLVHVFVNLCCSSHISAHDQLWRAAVAMRVCEMLERAGKTVAITVGAVYSDPWTNRHGLTFITCPVKSYGQRVTEERVAAMFTAGFWRLFLMDRARYSVLELKPSARMGVVVDSYEVLPLDIEQERDNGAHVVVIGGAFSENSASRLVRKVMAQFVDKDARPEGQRIGDMRGAR